MDRVYALGIFLVGLGAGFVFARIITLCREQHRWPTLGEVVAVPVAVAIALLMAWLVIRNGGKP